MDTWYLEPDLSVVWSVLERDVRSTAKSADDRRRIATFPIGEILNSLDKKQNDEPTVFSLRWKDR